MGCDGQGSDKRHQRAISIHAPTWGATRDGIAGKLSERNFNPRTHVGCDRLIERARYEVRISIHAPTWGATSKTLIYIMTNCHFNPRTHVGCDVRRQPLLRASIFQSTHPRGVRRRHSDKFYREQSISIHAPTWGATRPLPRLLLFYFISIHAPTWGATPRGRGGKDSLAISIHAPTWGATSWIALK